MKKIKIEGKLNLEKMTVAKLNEGHLASVVGGGVLSIGKKCTKGAGTCGSDYTKGIFCVKPKSKL